MILGVVFDVILGVCIVVSDNGVSHYKYSFPYDGTYYYVSTGNTNLRGTIVVGTGTGICILFCILLLYFVAFFGVALDVLSVTHTHSHPLTPTHTSLALPL